MKKTASVPTEKLACFIILAESEGVETDKQCVCFVLAAEVLVLHGTMWGMKSLLKDGASRQLSSRRRNSSLMCTNQLVKELFRNL